MKLFTLRRIRQEYRAWHFNPAFYYCAAPVEHSDRSNVNEFTAVSVSAARPKRAPLASFRLRILKKGDVRVVLDCPVFLCHKETG